MSEKVPKKEALMARKGICFVPAALAACGLVFIGICPLPGVLNAQGQTAASTAALERVLVTITHVKPEMVPDYQAAVSAEGIPALKKAGVPWRHTYRTGPFGDFGVFVAVQPVTGMAQFDQPGAIPRMLGEPAATRYAARTRSMIVSQKQILQTFQPALSIRSNIAEPAKLIVVEDVQLYSGKGQAFAELTSSKIVPALNKAGVKDFWVYNTTWGGPAGSRTLVEPIESYAALEAPLALLQRLEGIIGTEAAQRISAERSALVEHAERTVLRLVPELTFTTQPTGKRTSTR